MHVEFLWVDRGKNCISITDTLNDKGKDCQFNPAVVYQLGKYIRIVFRNLSNQD